MPKRAKITVFQRTSETDNRGGWWVNVPAGLSETGKRQKIKFDNRDLARAERDRLERAILDHGKSPNLPPDVVADCGRAMSILAPLGATLTAAATYFQNAHDTRAKSKTLGEVFDEFLEVKQSKSTRYLQTLRYIRSKVPGSILQVQVCDITRDQLRKAIEAAGPTPTTFNTAHRILRAVMNHAVNEEYTADNPTTRIKPMELDTKPPAIVTLDQARWVLDACRDLRGGDDLPERFHLDCRDCLPAFAVMLFAGLRPDEVVRLDWVDIELDERNIRIPAEKSKTDTLRNVHIEDCLLRWLVPFKRKAGKVTGRNWKRKATAIRAVAGISDDQDILRHSYGSYWLAANGDTAALQSAMGHTHLNTYLKHYHRAVKKKDAIRFWKIEPRAREMRERGVA